MGTEIIDNISGVEIIPLNKFVDERGAVMHMLRSDSEHFDSFGEVYFSQVNPGIIKGWKKHFEIHQNMAVPQGSVEMVIFDDREDSSTKGNIIKVIFGEDDYKLLKMPPNLWYSFKGISDKPSLIVNCITAPHDPNESTTLPLETEAIPFNWDSK